MIGVLIVQGTLNLALAVLCWRMYRDVLAMARTMAGMPPVVQDSGNARIISPYKKKKEGDGS